MKSRPILFSAAMVRALLDGSKTHTRRVAKLTDAGHVKEVGGHRRWHPADPNAVQACPYGQPGDQLWVKETHWRDEEDGEILYAADPDGFGVVEHNKLETGSPRYNWKPSIFMRREYSRITLEIAGVRVERLQDISEGDAAAEGWTLRPHVSTDPQVHKDAARDWYMDLWGAINGPGSWEANPLVWVVEFKVVKP